MKSIFLFIICLWQLNSVEAQTNVYHPFPSDSATWNVGNLDIWFGWCYKYSYSFTGDTIVNNTSYHKIWKQGQEFLVVHPPGSPDWYYTCSNQVIGNFSYYVGAIREDISQKKIYFLQPNDSTETLLYDFTLNVGDTIKGYFGDYHLVILSLDSTLVGTQYRKTWNIDPSSGWGGTPHIVEGVGCLYGLLEAPYAFEKSSIALECFSVNNQSLYPTYNATEGCNLLTSIKDKNEIKNMLSIFPNPSNGKFEIIVNNQKINTIEISDILGNLILKSEINKESALIDLSDKLNGVYLARITNSIGNIVVKKIVKQ